VLNILTLKGLLRKLFSEKSFCHNFFDFLLGRKNEMNPSSSLRQNAHAVIIGINKYQDQKIPNLTFACADAEGVYQILTDPELGRIPPDNVILLLDEEATQRNIRSAIGTKIPKRAGEQDMVYIYYAGHGSPVMDPKSRSRDGMEKYLVPTDAELDDLRATGISMDEIQRFFGWIESKQVMFFIDSCYSGEAGGRTFQNPLHQTRNLLSAEFLEDLAGEGRLVVTACDVNEVSLETPDIGHGLFTHYLIEGLKGVADKDQDGLVTIHELYDYVYEQVSQHARKLGGSMHPIQKGSVKGKIFLTEYETAAQKQAKPLYAQAQAFYKAEKFGEAYQLWQQVIKLVPDHAGARQGLVEIENRLQEEKRRQQEILERKQRLLLSLFREGHLPSEEFDAAMALIEKSPGDLTALERETRRLLDELTGKKISAASYVKSVRLLRKPVAPEEPPPLPKPQPPVVKPEPVAPKPKPEKPPIPEGEKVLPAKAWRKRIIAGSAALGLIGLVILAIVLQQTSKPKQESTQLPKPSVSDSLVGARKATEDTIGKLSTEKQEPKKPPITTTPITEKRKEDKGAVPPKITTEKSTPAIHLRSTAIADLSEEQVKAMLVRSQYDFYDRDWNKDGKGITHNYVEQTLHGDKVVIDKTTGLMWQQSGSDNYMTC
jgi:uncharacterized caspase-like protein